MNTNKPDSSRSGGRAIVRRKKPYSWVFYVRLIVLVASFVAICLTFIYTMEYIGYSDSNVVVKKTSLQIPISAIIRNGGDLDAVKHVYASRIREKRSFIIHHDAELYYPYEITLSSVLNDMKCGYLVTDPFEEDSLYYSRLLSVIQENDYHNPFDNLEPNQRYYFENIRAKAGLDYDLLREDVSKIADELQNKNQLVERYLKKSTVSFIISIIALALTIILSVIQIVQNNKTSKLVKEGMGVKNKQEK